MRLKVVDRLDFSVGGYQAADGALLDNRGSNRDRVVMVSYVGSKCCNGRQDHKRRHPPAPRPAFRTVSIQWHTGKSVTFNVSSTRCGRQANALRTCLVRCIDPAVGANSGAVIFVSRVIAESIVLRRIISREDFLMTLSVIAV